MGLLIAEEKLLNDQEQYLLDRNSAESRRLNDQHEILLKAAGGYIPTPLSVQADNISAILDIGTGNAQWLLGLRQSGIIASHVELYGVEQRFGINLEVCDLCQPLPSHWNQKFDLIHGRHVLIWIEPRKWPTVLNNLKQALKPGGTLVIMYPGEIPYDIHTDEPLALNSAPMKLFSAFIRYVVTHLDTHHSKLILWPLLRRYTDYEGLPRRAGRNLPKMMQQAGFDPKTITTQTSKINLGRAEPDVTLRPASSRHLDFVVQKTRKMSEIVSFDDIGCPSCDDEDGG
ncbi:S-adenosyl-L-methionine-dependent methyltransferase [Melampsora americana]|nr:S-adenosyl-L-methionine-dependent methyltransferase [Melampsora americana]